MEPPLNPEAYEEPITYKSHADEYHPNPSTFLAQLHIVRDVSESACVQRISDTELYRISKMAPWTLCTNEHAVLKLYTEWYLAICEVHEQYAIKNNMNIYPRVQVTTDLDIMPFKWWIKV